MAGPDSLESEGDVQMGDADSGAGGGSLGNGNGDGDAPILKSVEQPSNLPHSNSGFEVKPDPEEDDVKPPSSSPTQSKMGGKTVPKKKGTAAAKKVPKKTRKARAQAARKAAAAKSGTVLPDDDEESSDDEIDNGPYCICRGPDDHRWMISCDACEDWFHGECIDLDKELGEKLIERFVCPNCTDGKLNYTKYKKTCSLDGCTDPARLYGKKDHSVFCSNEHCDAWWNHMIRTLPKKNATIEAAELLTQEDFMGLLASTANQGEWKLGEKPFGAFELLSPHSGIHDSRLLINRTLIHTDNWYDTGNIEGFWANGLPTRPDVLSDEELTFLQTSAAERLALGNEIIQYKKMMQLIDWANQRRQTTIEQGKFTKDSCGYDYRLDVVSVRHAFAAWAETPEGQATFTAGKLDTPISTDEGDAVDVGDVATRGMCEKKRCKAHNGWYKLLMSAVRNQVKETATAASDKLDAESSLRQEAESRYERRQVENNWVEVINED
ncbi:s.t1.c1 complex component spp1 [Apiospora arundinis]|uniref:S.t1.c1 complex component spp1 n=1 Tax=Apiospora arundinis TaxID=335852 RepID=A0ABR2JHH6_9PEZI